MHDLVLTWRQYRLERRMFWRNPSAAFFNFLFPLILLALFGAVFAGDQEALDVIVPGIAGMAVMSTTFTALAWNMVFLREQGVLKRMRGTPLPPAAYLSGIGLNALTNAVLQLALVIAAGRVFLGTGWPHDWAALALFAAAGVVCFGSLGVALSHAIPNFDSAGAYINAIFLPVIFISGVFYDVAEAPGFIKDIAEALPLKHVIDGLSAGIVGASVDTGVAALIVGGWAVAGIVLAARFFRWE